MPLTVKRAACGILDQWSVMDGHVRVAIVAESEPVPILIRGELPKRTTLADVGRLIRDAKTRLKGGL